MKLYNEDCRDTLKKIDYHYALFSPPDFEEIGMEPKKDQTKYKEFLKSVISELKPINGTVTMLNTDRLGDGTVYLKHVWFKDIMEECGYKLISQKIWIKSFKINLFRLNYAFIMTYAKGKPLVKNSISDYRKDCFTFERKSFKGYNDNQVADLWKPFIETFTNPGETVYDPFAGIGTVGEATMALGRDFIGSELDPKTFALLEEYLKGKDNV